jgi:serine phosphatase RsbU (regulator of sigma subunit)
VRLLIEPREGDAFEHALEGPPLVVGRAPGPAGLVLSDTLISRRHARFYQEGDAWWIEDLGARNRTFHNDRELNGPVPLREGDVVRIGHTVLHVFSDDRAGAGVARADAPGFDSIIVHAGSVAPSDSSVDTSRDRQTERLRILNEVHRALATTISLDELLDLILDRCFALLQPEQGVILLSQPDGEMRRAAARRVPGEPELLVSRRIVQEVVGKAQPVLALDVAQDVRFSSSPSIEASGVRSVVAAPLLDGTGTLGMIALYSRLQVRRYAQADLDVLVSLASAAALRVRNVALAEEAAVRRVLEHELALAHDIQMAMLTRAMPEHPAVEVAARVEPARSVGGDLYDVVIEQDRLWLVVADVSGKGVAAALFMAVAKTLFQAAVPVAKSVAEVVARINRGLCRDNERSMFVTALVACVDLDTGLTTLCDAGHNPPVVLGRDGAVRHPTLTKNIALGVVDDLTFHPTSLQLQAGDTLVLYTDGITEARNSEGTQFELRRLERCAGGRPEGPASFVVDDVIGEVEQFSAGAPQEDDLTVLVLRYRGHGKVETRAQC